MTSYKEFLSANDSAISNFRDNAASLVEAFLKTGDELLKAGAVSDDAFKAYDVARLDLARQLAAVTLALTRKIPTQQNEDTFGVEVQQSVIGTVGQYVAKLRCQAKEDSSVTTYKSYVDALAALHKERKERPDGYPKDLDDKQTAALALGVANKVGDSYHTMAHLVVHVATLLEKNEKLLEKPKRSYESGFM
eukprot:TRINITY_DN229_c0_g1_i1.p2 TRINITY_DN229_c0_g1~~TRINITY_DN229_c0_g1_i1.p2  ORF type:complete len:192 (+),score=101.65 TRINITY_DN229_c0_g1_i1:58-633(+)